MVSIVLRNLYDLMDSFLGKNENKLIRHSLKKLGKIKMVNIERQKKFKKCPHKMFQFVGETGYYNKEYIKII